MGERSGTFTSKVNNGASIGKTTDEIVHLWNQAHSKDMIIFDSYGCQADCEPARMEIEEWLSSFQKTSEFDISCNGNYNLFCKQQPGSIAVQMIQDAGQGDSLSLQG